MTFLKITTLRGNEAYINTRWIDSITISTERRGQETLEVTYIHMATGTPDNPSYWTTLESPEKLVERINNLPGAAAGIEGRLYEISHNSGLAG